MEKTEETRVYRVTLLVEAGDTQSDPKEWGWSRFARHDVLVEKSELLGDGPLLFGPSSYIRRVKEGGKVEALGGVPFRLGGPNGVNLEEVSVRLQVAEAETHQLRGALDDAHHLIESAEQRAERLEIDIRERDRMIERIKAKLRPTLLGGA